MEQLLQAGALASGIAFGAFMMLGTPSPPTIQSFPSPTGSPSNPISTPRLETVLLVDLSERAVYVTQGKTLIARYPVAVGKEGSKTPTGHFRVTDMQVNPSWKSPFTAKVYPPSLDNPIGDRWIEFLTLPDGNKIGFHGTHYEGSVGRAASAGCLRMKRTHLHALYRQVHRGTPVIVKN